MSGKTARAKRKAMREVSVKEFRLVLNDEILQSLERESQPAPWDLPHDGSDPNPLLEDVVDIGNGRKALSVKPSGSWSIVLGDEVPSAPQDRANGSITLSGETITLEL